MGYEITAPDGTVYHWDKPTPPTQADYDALQAYHAQTHPSKGATDPSRIQKPGSVPAVAPGKAATSANDPHGDPADAPASGGPMILGPTHGRTTSMPTNGRVVDSPTPPSKPYRFDLGHAYDAASSAMGTPDDGKRGDGVVAPGSAQDQANQRIDHAQRVAQNVAGLPFDLAGFYATVTGGGRQVTLNERSGLAGNRQLKIGRDRAAGMVAYALGLTSTPGSDANGAAPPLDDHERMVVQNLLDPKSATFQNVRALVRRGVLQGKPMSGFDQAMLGGAGPSASAIVARDPGIGDATTMGIVGRAVGAAMAPASTARVLTGDARPDSDVSPVEGAAYGLADLLAFGGLSGLGAKAAATYAGEQGAKALARTVGAKVLARVASTAGENVLLQAAPVVGQASDLSAQNGRPFSENLKDVAAQAGQGFARLFNPATLTDPKATAYEKAQTALTLGLLAFGAGVKGYEGFGRLAEQRRIGPKVVESLVRAGREEALRNAGSLRRASTQEGATLDPGAAPEPPQDAGTPIGQRPPLLIDPARRGVPDYLRSDAARSTGQVPTLVGDDSPLPTSKMPNGEDLIRNATDRARLQAMQEEFGPHEGMNRYVADRMGSPPVRDVPPIITGDEVSKAEHDALSRRLAALQRDRASLDAPPPLPKDAEVGLVHSVDPDGEALDPFSDDYNDGLAATLHHVLFGEPPTRDARGDVSSSALGDVRDEIRARQAAEENRARGASATLDVDDLDHVEALAQSAGVRRDPETTKDYVPDHDPRDVPNGPEDIITAKRAGNRRGWKVNHSRTSWVNLDGLHPETARELVSYALSRESDHSYLRRGELTKWKQKGIRPNFMLLSEMIEKEVGDAWKGSDFDQWHRIGVPRKIVAEYVRDRLAHVDTAREVLKSMAPHLTQEEIQNVVEHYAQGGRLPGEAAGDGRPSPRGGEDGPLAGEPSEGDLGPRRPASPRQPARERLDREIAQAQARIDRARVTKDRTPRVARLGDPDPSLPKAKPLLGPDGGRADGKPTNEEANRGRQANPNRRLILPSPDAARVQAGDPAMRAYAPLDTKASDVLAVAAQAAKNPLVGELRWRNEADYGKVRQEAVSWMQKRKGKPMPTPVLGVDVRFSGESVKKLRGNDVTAQRMAPLIPDLLQRAELVHNTEGRDAAKTGMTGTWLVARLNTTLDGHYNVFMFVRRMHNGDFEYDHGYDEVVKAWSGPASKTSGVRNAESASTTDQPAQAPHSTPTLIDVSTDAPEGPATGDTRNADTQAVRSEMDLGEAPKQPFASRDEGHAAGRAAVESGADHVALADSIIAKPRPISAEENGVLREGGKRLLDAARKARADRDASTSSGDAEGAAAHQAEYVRLRDLLDRHTEALQKAGREWSAAGVARQGMDPVDLANAESVVQQARWERGGGDVAADLDPKSEAAYRDLAARLAAKEAELEEANARASKAEAERAVRSQRSRDATGRTREAIRADRAKAIEDFNKATLQASGQASSGIPISAEQIKALGRIARTFIEEGALTVEEMVAKVKAHLEEHGITGISDRQIRDAYSGHGIKAEARPQTEVQARVAELSRVARLTSEVEDAENGVPVPSVTKTKPSEEIARLTKVRDALRKEKGLAPQTGRVLRSVEETVDILQRRADEIEALTKDGKTPAKKVASMEAEAVRDARKRLQGVRSANKLTARVAAMKDAYDSGDLDAMREAVATKPRAKADGEVARLQGERDLMRARLLQRLQSETPKSFGENIARYHGASVLSGPGILAKLAGASAAHIPTEVASELPAMLARALSAGDGKKLGDVALGEARSRLSTYTKGVAEFLKGATYKDAYQKLRTGVNSLDAAAVARGQIKPESHGSVLEYVGHLHGAIKTPLQRASFEMSVDRRLYALERGGVDVSTPEVQTMVATGAYADSLNAILKGDNRAADLLNDLFRSTETRFGKGTGAVARTLAPVTKVPLNFAGKTLQSTGLGLLEGAFRHVKALRSDGGMTPQAADTIIRAYRRGGIGLGLVGLVFGTDLVKGPGLYRTGATKGEDEEFGDLDIAGVHIPHQLGHNPICGALNVLVTARDSFVAASEDRYAQGDQAGELKRDSGGAIGATLSAVAQGVGGETPGVQQAMDVGKAALSEKNAGKTLGRYAAGYIPQGVQAIARATDPVKREDGGFLASIAATIPGLRQTLPEKKAKAKKGSASR